MDALLRFRRPRSLARPSPNRARRERLASGFALTLALLLVAACASPSAPSTVPSAASGSIGPAATATAAASPVAAATFPLTVTDDEGTSVEIKAAPQRIVSLTPATTEILFALGLGDRIVAKVEDPASYPAAAARIPNVAKFGSVDVEKIVGLEADLVIAGGNTFTPPEAIAQLRSLKVPTVVVYAPTIDKVFADIELTGLAAGKAQPARELADSMRADFDLVSKAMAGQPKPKVFYEIDATGAIYGPADKSFLAEMIRLAGGDPITTGSPDKFDIPVERLIDADPTIILLGDAAYGVSAADVAARPGWNVISAVRTKTIRPIDDIVVTRPGPRITSGLRSLAAAIHPDVALPSPAP
ncbi:MAG TPA: ABC transporter substrate-binding protein [Candidatus Limnocylindrales bacterium]|nr:ABC transporter substrate-binding protein [Candidatus Limnocylindrales bacterium]